MINPKVSVIVPAYNCETYIERCLNSIVGQTLQPIEIIVIDDGSTDRTGIIIDTFAVNYGNIIVVHQENGGVSSARNAGLALAKGEYIGFVDADDYIAPDMFERLYEAAIKVNADMAMCDYNMVYRSKILCNMLKLPYSDINIGDQDIDDYYLKYVLGSPVLWNKIFRTRMIRDAAISFEMDAGEDLLFCIEITAYVHKVALISEGLYYYLQRKSSIVHSNKTLKVSKSLISQFVDRIQYASLQTKVSDKTNYYVFATMFTGFMFSPNCIHQPIKYFSSQIQIMRQWVDFPHFCYLIAKTDRLSKLYERGAISVRFYRILKLLFYLCLKDKDGIAAYVMFVTTKLIYIKKRKFLLDLHM